MPTQYSAAATVPTGSSHRFLALAGIVFPLLFAITFVLDATYLVGDIPRPDSPVAEVVEFYQANQGTYGYVRGAVRLSAAASLAIFALYVTTSRALDFASRGSRLSSASLGVASALSFAASPALSITVNTMVDSASSGTLAAIREWNYLLGGTLHLAALGAFAGLLTLASWPSLSRTLRGFGVATATLCLAVPLAEIVNPAARFVSWAWLVMLAVTMLRRAKH